jgi:pimeloyl-ACP methyl ester carboxylesterase
VRQVIRLVGGRGLAVEISGAPDGIPVFLLHGTPGSRSGPKPRGIFLYRQGVRLISYDRPGYGDSDRHPGRTVADAAADVAAIADALEIDRFSVVGRSGGGPHALACAARLDRVEKVAVLVSLAPSNAEGLDWYDGMTPSNITEFSTADSDVAAIHDLAPELGAVRTALAERAYEIRDDPESLIKFLLPELAGPDRRVVDDVAIRRQLMDTYVEALRRGPDGWIDDLLALRRFWGFDLGAIKAPTLLWHGADDMFSPVGHTEWLAERIPNSITEVQQGAAHFGAVEILPKVLAWIAAPAGREHRFAPSLEFSAR